MRSISTSWPRRMFASRYYSLCKTSAKRHHLRKLILENLEPRQLMTSAPWQVPPLAPGPLPVLPGPVLPSLGLPGAGLPGNQANAPVDNGPWSPPGNPFFGPREKVWISDAVPTVEAGQPGYFRIERTNPQPPLQVTFNFLADSTAQKGVDYLEPKPIVVFEPGQVFVDVPIVAIDDAIPEPNESVRVVLWDASRVGTWVPSDSISVLISDNDFGNRAVAVELLPAVDGEEGFRDGRVRARRTGPTDQPLWLPFELSFGDSLVLDQDFRIDPKQWSSKTNVGQFHFPTGESLASVGVSVIDDPEPESTEWMEIRLLPSPNAQYQLAGKQLQTLRILDNDSKPKSLPINPPGITQVSLVNDTGASSSDRITSDERLAVVVDGKLPSGTLKTEFDWNGDFIPDASFDTAKTPGSFEFDPREYDARLAQQIGSRIVQYRSKWFSKDDVLIEQSPWESYAYSVVENPTEGPLRLSDLRLKIDTGNPSDRITTNPIVTVTVLGQFPQGTNGQSTLRIEWDQTHDGIAEHSQILDIDNRRVEYDPRSIDPSFARIPGPRNVRVRLVDALTAKPLVHWETIEFSIPNTPVVPWIVSGMTHSNGADDAQASDAQDSDYEARRWILRGQVIDPNHSQGASDIGALESPTSNLSVQIDDNQNQEPDATVPVAQDLSFEHTLENLGPGTHLLRLRVQQWSSELNMFVSGNWTEYSLRVTPADPPAIPVPRLRNDTGPSTLDRLTSDPTILIDVTPSVPRRWLTYLDIDTDIDTGITNNDSRAEHSIPVSRSSDGSPSLIVFREESIQSGSHRYRFRTRSLDPVSLWESTSQWSEFAWSYLACSAPSMRLELLSDDGSSRTDRITSIPTLLGHLDTNSECQDTECQDPETALVQIDWDSDGRVDDTVRPTQDGSFTIRPERSPLGPRRVGARVEWTDPYRNTEILGNWTSFDFQLTESPNSQGDISGLSLLFDTGRSATDRVSSIPTITGHVLQDREHARIQVDRNGDGVCDDEISLGSSRRFQYSPMSLNFGTHLFAFRTCYLNPAGDRMAYGTWQPFDFTYVASTIEPLVIESIELANDSGLPGDRRSEQGTIAGRVSSLSGIVGSVVLVDLNQDQQADEMVAVDNDGRFLFDPMLTSNGQATISFKPIRITPSIADDSASERWIDFTFILEDQTDTAPELYDVVFLPTDNSQSGKIVGSVRSQGNVDGMLIEIDANGDGRADRTTQATAYAGFSLSLDDLSAGDYTYRIRAALTAGSAESMLIGSWQSVSFRISGPSTTPAKIRELRLRFDDGFLENDQVTSNPSIAGRIDRDAASGMMVIELDLNGDSIIDDRAISTADLSFQYTPTQLSPGTFQIRARTKELLPTGELLRSEWSEIRGKLVAKEVDTLRIDSLELVGDQGPTSDDHRTSQPMLTGFVGGPANAANAWLVDIDIDGDGMSDQSIAFWGNRFTVTPQISQPGMVDLALRLRSDDSSQVSSWQPLSFLYHPQPRSAEANTWVATYRTIASGLSQGASQYVQGLGQAITKLAHDRAALASEAEVRNEQSLTTQLIAIRESTSGYWEQHANAELQLSESQSQAFAKLREQLRASDSAEVDLPLPEELAILWPTDRLPELPYLAADWLPAEESMPRPPVDPPNHPVEASVPKISFSESLSEALNQDDLNDIGIDLSNDEAYQSQLQRLRTELLSAQRLVGQSANRAASRAQEIYDAAIADAENRYRLAMFKLGQEFNGLFKEDYAEVLRRFAEDSQSALEQYQSLRQSIEDSYRAESQLLSDAHAQQIQAAERNRDSKFESANRELASVLNTVPPPSWSVTEAALIRHSLQRYEAQHTFDRNLLTVQSHERRESYKLQRARLAGLANAQLEYDLRVAQLEQARDFAIAEQKLQYSLRRANAADRWDSGAELADHQLQVARTNAWGNLQQALIQVERDRQVRTSQAIRQFDLAKASQLCSSVTRLDNLLSSPESHAQLQRAKSRQELLQAWDRIYERTSAAEADCWKERALAKHTAEFNKRLDSLSDQHEHRNARLEATLDFRTQHARLVRSHAIALADKRFENVTAMTQAKHSQSLDSQLNGIAYLEGESTIAQQFRQQFLDSLVYQPPKINGWLGGWGWIDGNFLGAVSGSAMVPAGTSFQMIEDQAVATAQLVYLIETSRIAIDKVFFEQRDGIEATYAQEAESLASSSSSSEFQILRKYHLATAQADRTLAIAQVDRMAKYESAIADADKAFRIASNSLVVESERELAIGRLVYEKKLHQVHVDFLIEDSDEYLDRVQAWRDSSPSDWTDYQLAQAMAERNFGVKRAQLAWELAKALVDRTGQDKLKKLQIEREADSRNASSVHDYERSKIAATRELAAGLAEAKYRFAEETAGAIQGPMFGRNIEFERRGSQAFLPWKLEAADVTSKADLQLAQAQLHASLERADAEHTHSTALYQMGLDLSAGNIDWAQYLERLAMVDRIYNDKLREIASDLLETRQSTDRELRAKRSEIVRLLNIEQELSKPIEAQWAWLEDIPKIAASEQANVDLASAIQAAEDRFVERIAALVVSRDEALASNDYQQGVDVRKVYFDGLDNEHNLATLNQIAENQADEARRGKGVESRNTYEKKMLDRQAKSLEKIYRQIDANAKALLKQQALSLLLQQAAVREAQALKESAASTLRLADHSDRLIRQLGMTDQIQQAQEQQENLSAQAQRAWAVQESRQQGEWMVATRKAATEYQKTQALIQIQNDKRSVQALEALNRKLLEQRQLDAQQVGQAWKDYYLSVHPESGATDTWLRKDLDNWLGLRVKPDWQTASAWRSRMLDRNGLEELRNSKAASELSQRLEVIRSVQAVNRTEAQVEFAVALGQSKADRIGDLWDAYQGLLQATTAADRSHAQQTYKNSVELNTEQGEAQAQATVRRDQLELAIIRDDQSSAIRNARESNSIELVYQDRIHQASVDYERSWADAQADYHRAVAQKRADGLQKDSTENLRSVALAAHAKAYAHWIEAVSPDYVDWVGARAIAQADHSERKLQITQEREIAERVAKDLMSLQSDTLRREAEKDKSDLALVFSIDQLTSQYEALQDQRQIDLDYQLLVLSHESKFLEAVERAESAAQVMKLRGFSPASQSREKSLLVADARYLQTIADSDARMDWKDHTAEQSPYLGLENAQRAHQHSIQLQRIDATLRLKLAGLEQQRADALARARFDYQVHAIEASGDLHGVQTDAQGDWLVATAGQRVVARESLQEAVPGSWSDFLVVAARRELAMLDDWQEAEQRLSRGRSQADIRYQTTIARAQLDESLRLSLAERTFSESEINQGLVSFEVKSQALVDYMEELQAPANQYINHVTMSERSSSQQVATAELELRKDLDASKYQDRLEQAKEYHESGLVWMTRNWSRDRATAISTKRSTEAELERSDRLAQISRESRLAQETRDARKELIDKEADAYFVSEQSWSQAESLYARETSRLQTDMADHIDQELHSQWSSFFADVTQAKARYNQQMAEAMQSKVSQQSQQQAGHEKRQGQLQWESDSREWLASDHARRTVAQMDWALEQVRILAIKGLAQAMVSNQGAPAIPEHKGLDHPRMPMVDRRYELLFREDLGVASQDVFVWQDTGFLAWIRSPQDQFAKAYWSLETIVTRLGSITQTPRNEQVELPTAMVDSSARVFGVPEASQTPTHKMTPATPLTLDALARVDREVSGDVVNWLDMYSRVLPALDRPDYFELLEDRTIIWEVQANPIVIDAPVPQTRLRFFVQDQSQWNEFLKFSSESHGEILGQVRSDFVQRWAKKYQQHVGEDFDSAKSKLLSDYSAFTRVPYNDRVVEVRGVAYWRHAIGLEPVRIQGDPSYRFRDTPIGAVDRLGWVYLPSGNRVLLSALRKWADELVLGNTDQINTLIDGLISPFSIDGNSKQYGIFIGGTGMHMFGLGNVERLYNLYQGTKFYYGGVGNPTEYDSIYSVFADNGAGYGWTRILDRIEADVLANYRGHQRMHIFGWSRGAAMSIEFARRMQRYGIKVDFLGLFDPVYSYTYPGQSSALVEWTPDGRAGNYVTAIPNGNVKAIGAIYAANEDRSFFPATRLYPDGISRLKMMKSPGGHGEIGGHFLSNLILQRLNMRAMIEFAASDGQVSFEYRGIEPDLVRIYASPLTKKLQLLSASDPMAVIEVRAKSHLASKIPTWQAMQSQEYYRALVECNVQDWKPSGFGFQKDQYTGLVAFVIEAKLETSPMRIVPGLMPDGVIKQPLSTHYRRNLDWCELELWDMGFLQDTSGKNRLTDRQQEAIRLFYRFKIDPKTGEWIRSGL